MFFCVKNVWTGSKIGVKILEIKSAEITLHLINVAEINAQQNEGDLN